MLGTIALELFDIVRATSRSSTAFAHARERIRALAARSRATRRTANETAALQNTVLALRVRRSIRLRLGLRLGLRFGLGLGLGFRLRLRLRLRYHRTALSVCELLTVPTRGVSARRLAALRLTVVSAGLEALAWLRLRLRLSSNHARRSMLRAIPLQSLDLIWTAARGPAGVCSAAIQVAAHAARCRTAYRTARQVATP